MCYKDDFEKKRSYIIERLNKEGIKVNKGKRKPINRQYSGVIGRRRKLLRLNIPY